MENGNTERGVQTSELGTGNKPVATQKEADAEDHFLLCFCIAKKTFTAGGCPDKSLVELWIR